MSEFVMRTSSSRPDESRRRRRPIDGRRGRARVLTSGALAMLIMGSPLLFTQAASAQAATYPSGQRSPSAVAAHPVQEIAPILPPGILPPTLVPPAVLPVPGLPPDVPGTCLDLGSDSSARAKVCVGSPDFAQLFTRLEGRVNLLGASLSVSDARSLALQAISGGCIVALTPQGIANTQSDAGPSAPPGPLTPSKHDKTSNSTKVVKSEEARKADHRLLPATLLTDPRLRGTANSSRADGLVPIGFTESTYISPLPARGSGLPALGAAVSAAAGLLGHTDTVGNVDNAGSVSAAHAPLLGLGLPVDVHD